MRCPGHESQWILANSCGRPSLVSVAVVYVVDMQQSSVSSGRSWMVDDKQDRKQNGAGWRRDQPPLVQPHRDEMEGGLN